MDIIANSSMFMNEESPLAYTYTLETFYFDICKEYTMSDHQYLKYGDPEILIESGLTVVGRMVGWFKTLIDKFLNAIKNLNARMSTNILKLDEYCRQYKTKLTNIHVSFDMKGFEYTIHDNIDLKPFDDIITDYNRQIQNIKHLTNEAVDKMIEQNTSEEALSKLRAKIINFKNPISASDFTETVRRKYRNGEIDTKEIHIDNGYIEQIIKNSGQLTKDINAANKEKQKVEEFIKKTEILFDRKIPIIFKDGKQKMELKAGKDSGGNHSGIKSTMEASSNAALRAKNKQQKLQNKNEKLEQKRELQQKKHEMKMANLDRVEASRRETSSKSSDVPISDPQNTYVAAKQQKKIDSIEAKANKKGYSTYDRQYDYDDKTYEIATKYVRYLFNYTKSVSLMYTTVVTERTNALKEQSEFYMSVLRKVVGMSPNDGGNAHKQKEEDDE